MSIKCMINVIVLVISAPLWANPDFQLSETGVPLIFEGEILNPKYHPVEDWIMDRVFVVDGETRDEDVYVRNPNPVDPKNPESPRLGERSKEVCDDLLCAGKGTHIGFCHKCDKYGPYHIANKRAYVLCSDKKEKCYQHIPNGKYKYMDDLICHHETILYGEDCSYDEEFIIRVL